MDLRAQGAEILTQWSYEPSDAGKTHRVARYVLIGEGR
ncbi:MAG: helix-turn-helix domain-containing protein [Burkholderiaceae bacterium]